MLDLDAEKITWALRRMHSKGILISRGYEEDLLVNGLVMSGWKCPLPVAGLIGVLLGGFDGTAISGEFWCLRLILCPTPGFIFVSEC